MTDEQLDRRVRDADPYRPEVIAHLDGVAQDLLEEIMSTPILESVTEPPGSPSRPRRRLLSGLASAGVAAAVVAVVVGVWAGGANRPEGREPAPGRSSTSAAPGTVSYSAMVLKAAEENPRLLIDQPGWKATHVDGFAKRDGSVTYSNGGRHLRMSWYEASEYDGATGPAPGQQAGVGAGRPLAG
ncbi:hypothetical protein NKG94_23720 [Micromonospora sp. M12]